MKRKDSKGCAAFQMMNYELKIIDKDKKLIKSNPSFYFNFLYF